MEHHHYHFNLTLEQEFQIKIMELAAKQMSHEQLLKLLVQSSRSLMLKNNAIRALLEQVTQ